MARESKRVLVTGGAGFIGSHLVDRLVSEGCEVKVLDDLSSGSLANIRGHVRSGRVSFVEGDVGEADVVEKCVCGVDFVVHLAAVASVPFSVEHPVLTFEVNVDGTLNLLKACVESSVERFVFVSSCAVYGEPVYLPVDELHPVNPVSPYAKSKVAGERWCRVLGEKCGLETVVLRLFNVYGPRQGFNDYSGVITRFIEQIKRGLPLTIYGDGSQTRDFVYVSDVVEAVLQALKCEGVKGEVFNVGFGRQVSVRDLALAILRLARADLDVVYEAPRAGDVKHSVADISKAEKLLGFKPSFSLRDGLHALLAENALSAGERLC